MNKISLSVFDDKRFVLNYVIHALAYFHKDLLSQMITNKKIQKDSHRLSQIKISAYKQTLDRCVSRGTCQ